MRKLLTGLAIAAAMVPAWAGLDAWTTLPSPANGGTLINVVGTHPGNASTFYAGTDKGFYVSRDGGRSWQQSNGGIEPSPAGYRHVTDLAITGSLLYITPSFLQKSIDGGSSWQRTGWVSENPFATMLAVHPSNPNTVYAGTNKGVYKSTDAGGTWSWVHGTLSVDAITVAPGNPQLLFRAVSTGIFRSTDAGANWNQVSAQLTSVKTIVVDPRNDAIVYAGTNASGVYKSTDGGSTWTAMNRCTPGCAPSTMNGIWVKSIVVDPGNSNIVYLGATEGLYKSTDGGANWTQANNGPIGVTTMMLDPLNANTIIGAWGGQLYSYTFRAADHDRIFNWAEAAYPAYFHPPAATQAISGYQARYYSGTGIYVGSQGGRIYVYGTIFGGLVDVGATADLLSLAAAAGY